MKFETFLHNVKKFMGVYGRTMIACGIPSTLTFKKLLTYIYDACEHCLSVVIADDAHSVSFLPARFL